jgi:phospholipid/cholesterol/gamma-HCH transport system substrate-binding protein
MSREKKMKKYANETWIGLFMTAGLICVVYLSVQLGDVSVFGGDTYTLKARFNEISSLREGSSVTMMGIDIGRVAGVRIDQKRRHAVVRLGVDKDIRIYSDAIASIKTRGLIGEKYMEIDAGGAGDLLAPEGTIINTEPPIDLIELVGKYAFGSIESDE